MSSENDEFALQSRDLLVDIYSNFILLISSLNFDKSIPHFQFVNSLNGSTVSNLSFLGAIDFQCLFKVLSTFLILLCVIFLYLKKKKHENVSSSFIFSNLLIGTFSSIDLFSFYIFWIDSDSNVLNYRFLGGEKNFQDISFFCILYLVILMLVAIIFLYQEFGTTSIPRLFDFLYLMATWLCQPFLHLTVKIPMWPFHMASRRSCWGSGGSVILGILQS